MEQAIKMIEKADNLGIIDIAIDANSDIDKVDVTNIANESQKMQME